MENNSFNLEAESAPAEAPTAAPGRLMDARPRRVAQIMVRTVCEAAVAEETTILNRADLVAKFFREVIERDGFYNPDVEGFWALLLNRKNRLIMFQQVTSGTATAALAHPREVYRAAVLASASAIICVHNHPSGDPAPSVPDLQITHLLRDAGKTLDIGLLDHVIIGRAGADPVGNGYYSFREAGIL